MQYAKQKMSNIASAAREQISTCKAKLEEKEEKAAARTPEEKAMAKERRKAKEAQAKMRLHQAKAKHAAHKLTAKKTHYLPCHHHPPIGTAVPMAGATIPTYPLGGHRPGHKFK